MRAALLRAPGQVSVIGEWSEPDCRANEVVVAVAATGICGTDLAYFNGDREIPVEGLILGHEPWGTIVRVGSAVDSGRVGERVAIEPNYPCGVCAQCMKGVTSLCIARRSPVVTEHGFLAERVAVPAEYAWPLPASISERDASCLEPLAVVMAAVRRAGDLSHRPRIAITGAGSIGRILVDVLLRQNIVPAVIDLSEERLSNALAQGARQMQNNERFDLVFESSGSSQAAQAGVEMLDVGGLLVVIGVGNDAFPIDMKTLVRRGITVMGSMIYDHPSDYSAVIRAVESGAANPGVVLGEPFEFHEVGAAFSQAASASTKTWIRVTGGGSDG